MIALILKLVCAFQCLHSRSEALSVAAAGVCLSHITHMYTVSTGAASRSLTSSLSLVTFSTSFLAFTSCSLSASRLALKCSTGSVLPVQVINQVRSSKLLQHSRWLYAMHAFGKDG